MGAYADIQKLEPGNVVDLFVVDTSFIGGDVRRFHGYAQVGPIYWQGNTFEPWPIDASGFSRTGSGQPTKPVLSVGNVDGVIGALCRVTDDLIGARVTRFRTLGKYLDAANFPGGNPTADPDEQHPPEVWFVQQRQRENREVVEFVLASSMDFNGVQLPNRIIIANHCIWSVKGGYRGPYCNYQGSNYFDAKDNPVSDPAQDRCGYRLTSCKLRFGENNVLNFGGQPSSDGVRGY